MKIDPPELSDRVGAERHVELLEAYWRQRGETVNVRVVRVDSPYISHANYPRPFYGVRSDMRNGWPPGHKDPSREG